MPNLPPDIHASFLRALFDAAVARADPRNLGPLPLPPLRQPSGRTAVIGAGKASRAFTEALAKTLQERSRTLDEGIIICPRGCAPGKDEAPIIDGLTWYEAAHPVPDATSEDAARAALRLAEGLGEHDDLIVLLSGGGSSLMALPVEGVSLNDKRVVTQQMLKSGAPIQDINCIRRHLSQIKGGKLARAASPARVTTLVISDVVGNAPDVIASGPTVAGTSTPAQALELLKRYSENIPQAVFKALKNAAARPPDDDVAHTTWHLIATPQDAITAAADHARAHGPKDLKIHNLGCDLEGDAVHVATDHGEVAQRLRRDGGNHLIVSGGELTCRLPGDLDDTACTGGPNHVYALQLMIALKGSPGIYALACDTDGKDGSADAAGAGFGPEDTDRLAALNLDPASFLKDNNAGGLFAALGTQVVTGATHTNVNDFRAILICDSPDAFRPDTP